MHSYAHCVGTYTPSPGAGHRNRRSRRSPKARRIGQVHVFRDIRCTDDTHKSLGHRTKHYLDQSFEIGIL